MKWHEPVSFIIRFDRRMPPDITKPNAADLNPRRPDRAKPFEHGREYGGCGETIVIGACRKRVDQIADARGPGAK